MEGMDGWKEGGRKEGMDEGRGGGGQKEKQKAKKERE